MTKLIVAFSILRPSVKTKRNVVIAVALVREISNKRDVSRSSSQFAFSVRTPQPSISVHNSESSRSPIT
jgi:hypothetical protein